MYRRNTLSTPIAHLIGPGKLKCLNGRIVFSAPDKSPLRLDVKRLETLLCYGGVTFSDVAIARLLETGVQTAILSQSGDKCLGRIVAPNDSSGVLRLAQHVFFSNDLQRLEMARVLVQGKLQSQMDAMSHLQRHGCPLAGRLKKRTAELMTKCQTAQSIDAIRGFEGMGTRNWYEVLADRIVTPWQFPGRNRRPPQDPVNSLLSLSATLLHNRMLASLKAVGLETVYGALHTTDPYRPATLACDMIEPLRTAAVDRWVLSFCNQRKLDPRDFTWDNVKGCRLPEGTVPATVSDWEDHWTRLGLRDQMEQAVTAICTKLRQFASYTTQL